MVDARAIDKVARSYRCNSFSRDTSLVYSGTKDATQVGSFITEDSEIAVYAIDMRGEGHYVGRASTRNEALTMIARYRVTGKTKD